MKKKCSLKDGNNNPVYHLKYWTTMLSGNEATPGKIFTIKTNI